MGKHSYGIDRECRIQGSYIEILNPDKKEIKKVFIRDDMFYIKISDCYLRDIAINEFYKKMYFQNETKRLDYLLLYIRGFIESKKAAEINDKLVVIANNLQSKRNLM